MLPRCRTLVVPAARHSRARLSFKHWRLRPANFRNLTRRIASDSAWKLWVQPLYRKSCPNLFSTLQSLRLSLVKYPGQQLQQILFREARFSSANERRYSDQRHKRYRWTNLELDHFSVYLWTELGMRWLLKLHVVQIVIERFRLTAWTRPKARQKIWILSQFVANAVPCKEIRIVDWYFCCQNTSLLPLLALSPFFHTANWILTLWQRQA